MVAQKFGSKNATNVLGKLTLPNPLEALTTRTKSAFPIKAQQELTSSSDGRPFGHNRHGPTIGELCPLFWEKEAGSPSNTIAWAEVYCRTKWHLNPSSSLSTTDIGRKMEGLSPFLGGGAGSPSNTMSPGLRPTSVPSGILIHPAVWPQ